MPKSKKAAPAPAPAPEDDFTDELEMEGEEGVEGDEEAFAEAQEAHAVEEVMVTEADEVQPTTDYDHCLAIVHGYDPKFKRHQRENAQVYLSRLVRALSDIPEEQEAELWVRGAPDSVKAWYEGVESTDANGDVQITKLGAARAVMIGEQIPLPEGFRDEAPAAVAGSLSRTTAGRTKLPSKRKNAGGRPATPKPPKPPKERGFTVSDIRNKVIQQPDISLEDLAAFSNAQRPADKPFNKSTLGIQRSQTLSVIAAVKAAGHWID